MAACRPITPEIQEAEARGLGVQGQPGQLCETHLKLKKKKSKQLEVQLSGRTLACLSPRRTNPNKTQNKTKQKSQSPTSWRVQEPH